MKKLAIIALALFGVALVLGVAACSNASGGGGNTTATTTTTTPTTPTGGGTGTDNGEGQQTGGGNGNEQTTVTASCDYKKVDTVTINGIEYDIVVFGLWPQTIKADSVTVNKNTCQKETHGAFTYCKGSDNQWYVEQAEKAYGNYTYSDGTTVGKDETTTKWFKVEPIKWRVLTNSYGGNKLLLAESILTDGIQYYLNKSSRTIGGNTVYANNYKYSTIRAWLNGKYESDDTQAATHAGKGFLQSAFTSAQQEQIKTTTVDNSAESTTDASNNIPQATSYKCGNTSDKIFLLSEQEVTTSAYGFDVYDASGAGNKRIRVTTDFAKATGAYQSSDTGMGGWWWLRSPYYNDATLARDVSLTGDPNWSHSVDRIYGSVVPALCISN